MIARLPVHCSPHTQVNCGCIVVARAARVAVVRPGVRGPVRAAGTPIGGPPEGGCQAATHAQRRLRRDRSLLILCHIPVFPVRDDICKFVLESVHSEHTSRENAASFGLLPNKQQSIPLYVKNVMLGR